MENEIIEDVDAALDENYEKIGELLEVKERTPEQEAALKELKKQRGNLSKQRIGDLTKRQRALEAELAREREEKEELRRLAEERSKERESKQVTSGKYEKIRINGKEFYTEEALAQMVEDGKMTQTEAWNQQRAMIKEEAKAELKSELNEENTKTTNERIRQETIDEVLREYPHFNPKHPKHNAEDPLYKEASRLLNNGYMANPRGIKLAIEDAKKILNITGKRPDLSEELSIETGDSTTTGKGSREKKVELSEFEQTQAVRLYVFGGKVNPATGKIYTKQEAIEKALKAKRDRLSIR